MWIIRQLDSRINSVKKVIEMHNLIVEVANCLMCWATFERGMGPILPKTRIMNKELVIPPL